MLNIASRSSALAVGQSVSARIYGLVPLPMRLKLFPYSCSNASKGRFNCCRVEGVVGIHRVSPYTDTSTSPAWFNNITTDPSPLEICGTYANDSGCACQRSHREMTRVP